MRRGGRDRAQTIIARGVRQRAAHVRLKKDRQRLQDEETALMREAMKVR